MSPSTLGADQIDATDSARCNPYAAFKSMKSLTAALPSRYRYASSTARLLTHVLHQKLSSLVCHLQHEFCQQMLASCVMSKQVLKSLMTPQVGQGLTSKALTNVSLKLKASRSEPMLSRTAPISSEPCSLALPYACKGMSDEGIRQNPWLFCVY